jgi:hypothetical protein
MRGEGGESSRRRVVATSSARGIADAVVHFSNHWKLPAAMFSNDWISTERCRGKPHGVFCGAKKLRRAGREAARRLAVFVRV